MLEKNLLKIFYDLGALYGSTEMVQLKAITREAYSKENRLPDWANMKDNSHTL